MNLKESGMKQKLAVDFAIYLMKVYKKKQI